MCMDQYLHILYTKNMYAYRYLETSENQDLQTFLLFQLIILHCNITFYKACHA